MADQRKKDDDKKAGLPALNLRSAGAYGGAAQAAASGSGALLGLGTTGAKVALILVLTALGGGAYSVVHFLAPAKDSGSGFWHVGAARPADQPAVSAKPSASDSAAESSGLGMVSGSLDDRTASEKADDDAAKAAAAQQASAGSAASANTTAPEAAGSLTAQAGGPKPSPFAAKFGALSDGSSGGGQIGAALNGGAGMSGGVGLGFDRALTAPKNLTASRGKSASAIMSRTGVGSRGRGFAYRQLAQSSALSRSAAGASGETSSALANQAFTGQSAVRGSAITGGGAMGNTTGAGATQGGPLNGPTNQVVPQQGTQAPPTANATDVTPWGAQAKLAALLLTIAGIALLAAHIIAHFKLYTLAKFVAVAAAGLGAAAAALGVQLVEQGQTMFGGIFIAAGAIIAVLATKAIFDGSFDPQSQIDKAPTAGAQQAGQMLNHPAVVPPAGGTPPPPPPIPGQPGPTTLIGYGPNAIWQQPLPPPDPPPQ